MNTDIVSVMDIPNSLNPLTVISQTITQIAYYRQQIKMLETQQLQIISSPKRSAGRAFPTKRGGVQV